MRAGAGIAEQLHAHEESLALMLASASSCCELLERTAGRMGSAKDDVERVQLVLSMTMLESQLQAIHEGEQRADDMLNVMDVQLANPGLVEDMTLQVDQAFKVSMELPLLLRRGADQVVLNRGAGMIGTSGSGVEQLEGSGMIALQLSLIHI